MLDPTPLPDWNDGYPDPERLRHEVSCMSDAIVETLLDNIPSDEIQAIYLKGSAKKRWDTPIDYVPEASDLDVHVWFHDDELESSLFSDLDQAFKVQRDIGVRFRRKCPLPIHTPRPQIMILNTLLRRPGYMHSPPDSARVLFGEDYPVADYSGADEIERYKCHDMLALADIVDRYPYRVFDRPDKYLTELLRDLSYRVSPIGPIILQLAGIDPMTAWSMNRTRVTRALEEIGEGDLAEPYVGYFLARWRWFLSANDDLDAVRDTVRSALAVLDRAKSVANAHLSQMET
ncbi:MAG: hypothetical protein OXI33_08645 [Chloroflexota bacterium]|nr:hypothetical protein [Chloroflexota bacterium]